MRASTDNRHRLFVQAAIDYIADRLDERVRLEDLSRHIGLSPTYLQRIFRAQVGHHCGPASVRETYEACFRDWSPRYGWKPDARPMIVELGRGGDWSDASLYVAVTR